MSHNRQSSKVLRCENGVAANNILYRLSEDEHVKNKCSRLSLAESQRRHTDEISIPPLDQLIMSGHSIPSSYLSDEEMLWNTTLEPKIHEYQSTTGGVK